MLKRSGLWKGPKTNVYEISNYLTLLVVNLWFKFVLLLLLLLFYFSRQLSGVDF